MKTIYPICIAMLAAFFYSCGGDRSYMDTEDPTIVLPPTGRIIFNPALTYGTMTDQDGNSYKTITIGTQTWMAENLRTTKYSNGDPITNFTGTSGLPSGGTFCNYDNKVIYVPIYGRLYDKAAMQSNKNLAPLGWRIPGEADWKTLILYLDPYGKDSILAGNSFSYAASKLKEAGEGHWMKVDMMGGGGSNESGFTALPWGGWGWWSAEGYILSLDYLFDSVTLRKINITGVFYAVRCIKID
jgi:uncharacterized protein (TIGR02145 family)